MQTTNGQESPPGTRDPDTNGDVARRSADARNGAGKGRAGGGGGGYPETIRRVIDELASLPGIGPRSAERLAFYLLKSEREAVDRLAGAIASVKQSVRHCPICFNLTDADTDASGEDAASSCAVCTDPSRDASRVLVVEQPKDLIALEQTGMYKGVYHVLMGRISPLDGVGPSELTVADLFARLDDPASNALGARVEEVVLGLNPTLEGDGTALYLAEQIASRGVTVTRLARGLPAGSSMEFASKAVLADAIQGRRPM